MGKGFARLAALALALAGTACGASGAPPVAPSTPQRIVLVFVDTLRADHLGLYGYGRATSPVLDALAEDAVVFEAARSVSSWTLPAARSALTGRQPEAFEAAPTLAERLVERGFETAAFAANVYLEERFGIARGWQVYRCEDLADARAQTDRALAWLAERAGRPALLLVHYMDPHLPYREPASHRRLFAGEPPTPRLAGEFTAHDLRPFHRDLSQDERDFIRDRYDNNVRRVDDEIGRLAAALGERDALVVFSDHGEEFWEHGGFEHGRTLFEEVVRVPLLLRAPGLPPARVSEPVSLLDLTPTVLDLLGLPCEECDGTSLLPAARGDTTARKRLRVRPVAFGRPLYGLARWGVVHGREKYLVDTHEESLYRLAGDPREREDVLAAAPQTDTRVWHERLGAALGRAVRPALQLAVRTPEGEEPAPIEIELHVPGGVERAWIARDGLGREWASLSLEEREGDAVATVHWPGRLRSGEAYVVPRRPLGEVAGALRFALRVGAPDADGGARRAPPDVTRGALFVARTQRGRKLWIGTTFAPVPGAPERTPAVELDAELRKRLHALGYTADD